MADLIDFQPVPASRSLRFLQAWVNRRQPFPAVSELEAAWKEPDTVRKKGLLLLLGALSTVRHDFMSLDNPREITMVMIYALEHSHLLRYCLNPACKRPYFIARRGSQIYCSEPCAKPARLEAQQRWWREHGRKKVKSNV